MYLDAVSSQGLDQMAKHVGTDLQEFQDLFEWVSKIEPGNLPGEDMNPESRADRAHLCQGKSPVTAEEHLDTHETYDTGSLNLDPPHSFAGVVDELTRTAVERFNSAHVSSSSERALDPNPEKCRKRSRLHPCQETTSAASISDSVESDVVLVEHSINSAPRIWPCPFFVRDRASHLSCLTRHCLQSIDDVREHLCSVHLEPIYCSVCYETFPTVRIRDTHMRSRGCRHRLPVIFDSLRDSQVRELERQRSAADTVPDLQARQWIQIWSVVFSCTQPPPSPFSFSQGELEVYRFRDFWKRHGEDIIADVLAKHRLQQYDIKDEERNLELLYQLVADRAVDCMLVT
ncbi:hypothetical protein F5883DRAFT_208113 [Diaporthe sp. PMI_573]|nr:hypothetical protein F5883DRAFT_208113 [Diaporthaceae sp. PMI_573]